MITPLRKPTSPFVAICVTFTTVCDLYTCCMIRNSGILPLLELALVGATIIAWIRYFTAYVAQEIANAVQELSAVQNSQAVSP